MVKKVECVYCGSRCENAYMISCFQHNDEGEGLECRCCETRWLIKKGKVTIQKSGNNTKDHSLEKFQGAGGLSLPCPNGCLALTGGDMESAFIFCDRCGDRWHAEELVVAYNARYGVQRRLRK